MSGYERQAIDTRKMQVRKREFMRAGNKGAFLDRLIQLLRSMDSGEKRTPREYSRIPPDFGWTETEQEYQWAQEEWLRQVREKRERRNKVTDK